jgi:2'-5' RNA ligase
MSRTDAQLYARKWAEFTRLSVTEDTLAQDRPLARRWLLMPYVAFIIPIDDEAVRDRLIAWQSALAPWLQYQPQPRDRLHITLHYAGMLRRNRLAVLPYTWQRRSLPKLAQRVRGAVEHCPAFTVQIGPLNAFPNVLIAEVHAERECLRALRLRVRRALPLQARPPSAWTYLPHITLGFWGRQPVGAIVEALEPFRSVEPVPFTVRRLKLTVYERASSSHNSDVLAATRETTVAEFELQDS